MTTYPTDVHGPSTTARSVTGLVARCNVCHIQWQVKSDAKTDAHACPFCGALRSEGGVTIVSEAHNSYDAVVVD